MDYLIAVQTPCRPLGPGRFAIESAFAAHLRLLRKELGADFARMVLAAPTEPGGAFDPVPGHLDIVDADHDGIALLPLHPAGCPPGEFWSAHAPRMWAELGRVAREAGVIHGAIADDVRRPAMLLVTLAGLAARKPVQVVVDIDFRRDAWMYWRTGLWSLKSYLSNRLLHDPLRIAQVRLAVRYCDLVLLKSARMVADFGRGRPHVRNFYDTVHGPEQVCDGPMLERRTARLAEAGRPLSLVYFGRLVPYKGLDRSIRAVHAARQRAGDVVRLRIVGEGEEGARLRALVHELGLTHAVTFEPPRRYGAPLFDVLEAADAMVASPLVEDTPRAAFDAMARGLPILAFGIRYYEDLERESGAVRTVPWPDVEALAREMLAMHADREALCAMARAGVQFARSNTQRVWLERRLTWTRALLEPQPLTPPGAPAARARTGGRRKADRATGNGARGDAARGPSGAPIRGRPAASTAVPSATGRRES